jgi:hypothetical protein
MGHYFTYYDLTDTYHQLKQIMRTIRGTHLLHTLNLWRRYPTQLHRMKLADYYDFISVAAEIHSCFAPDRNPFVLGDVRDPIRARENARGRANILKEFEPLAHFHNTERATVDALRRENLD